mmetsp:Transcript_35156/g.67199  ORF Transcript_35156/g.67199 Transcript_35156/m.67199 type:complete len:231 (+) Transcript_35156:250-942(+)
MYSSNGSGNISSEDHVFYGGVPAPLHNPTKRTFREEVPEILRPRHSILHRPIRSQSKKNEESYMAQLEREQDALQRASHKYQHYELNKASAFDSSMQVMGHVDFERQRNLKATRDKSAPYYDFEPPGGPHQIHSSLAFASHAPNHQSYAGDPITWTREPNIVSPQRPWSADTEKRKGKAITSYYTDIGVYNPLTHQWTIEPNDPRLLDRECKDRTKYMARAGADAPTTDA